MQAEIITIGDEILIGQIVDTNSAWLGEKLNAAGIRIHRITSVSDTARHIEQAVGEALKRSDVVICTGGLGPTKDDITKHTLARMFGMALVRDEAVYEQVYRETFDLAVSRAVAALPVLCELCLPLVKPGGKFLAMKSVESDAELAASQHAIAILGGAVEAVRDYAIPGTDVRHRLIVVEKVKKTPEKYPRMFAKIKKNPL